MSLIQGFSLKDMFVGGKKTAKKHPKKHSKKSAKKGGYKKRKTMKKRPKKVKGGSSNYHDAYGADHHEEPKTTTDEGFKGHPEPFTGHNPNHPQGFKNKGGEEGFKGYQMMGGKKHKGKKHKRKTHKKKGGYEPTGVVTAALLTAAHMKKKGKKPKK